MTKRWAILFVLLPTVVLAQSKPVTSTSICKSSKTHLCMNRKLVDNLFARIDELEEENAAYKKAVKDAEGIMNNLTVEGLRAYTENDRLVTRYNALVDQYNSLLATHNALLTAYSRPVYVAPPVSRWQQALQGAAAGASIFPSPPAPRPPINCNGHTFNGDQFSWECR